ncbi:MAG: pyridoxamine 5'-phosphate oxidase [Candidatus Dormibacteraeota bacterium]|nr:pyridoxamine 5'-phosphate oxidase [Candidatus Dormibacteraeota bacterium]
MATWSDFEAAEPVFAARVRALFELRKHKTMATLRQDGSPRISGIEVEFSAGEVWLGMMPGSIKVRDLRRDARVAIHGPTVDPPEMEPSGWPGEAKMAGVAVEVDAPTGAHPPAHVFRIELHEVVLTHVSPVPHRLVIESWHPGRGLGRQERE